MKETLVVQTRLGEREREREEALRGCPELTMKRASTSAQTSSKTAGSMNGGLARIAARCTSRAPRGWCVSRRQTVMMSAANAPDSDSKKGPGSVGALKVVQTLERTVERVGSKQFSLSFATRPAKKQRVVILGTGWGAARLAKELDMGSYDLTIVSPRNHMVFTPLLASTTVGTLDFRSVAVSIRSLQPALGLEPNHFYTAKAKAVDPEAQTVTCVSDEGSEFEVQYDKLAIATGAQGSTFNIPGVDEYALPLRDVADASAIKDKLIKNIAKSQIPGTQEAERRRLLNFVIVGGGPTGVEFAGELSNLVKEDLARAVPQVSCSVRITLIEARDILGSFNPDLRLYASRILSKSGVEIVKAQVKEVKETSVVLSDGSEIEHGLLVWSTGVGPTPFITSLPFGKSQDGRLAVDEFQRVEDMEGNAVENVYSLGDCACNTLNPLPTTAQVAEQQGKWLSKHINDQCQPQEEEPEPFKYTHLGQMSAMTTGSAVTDLGGGSGTPQLSFSGFLSWLSWRAVYLTKLGSFQNKLYVLLNWSTSQMMGRDLSRW